MIELSLRELPDGSIEQWFKHVFTHEGAAAVEPERQCVPKANGARHVRTGGAPLTGRGYRAADACRYFRTVPGNLVEVTQFCETGGASRALGSAERNSEGRYIWWEERI